MFTHKFTIKLNQPQIIALEIQLQNTPLVCKGPVSLSLYVITETEDRDDEMFMALLLYLLSKVIDHFVKLDFVDAINEFKAMIPRKKRKALRSKKSALGVIEQDKMISQKAVTKWKYRRNVF